LEKYYRKRQEKNKPQGIKKMLVDVKEFFQSFLDRIFAEPKRKEKDNVSQGIPSFNPIISSIQSSITISPITDTNLVNLVCTHTDPFMAVRIVNTLSDVYKDYIDNKQLDTNRENYNWISEEIKYLKKKLDQSELKLHKYKEKSKIFSTEMDKNIQTQELSQIRSEINATQIRKNELKAQVKELESILEKNRPLVPTFIESEIIRNISNSLIKSQLELNQLYKTYKHLHPRVIKAKDHIAGLEKQFRQELTKVIGSMKSQILVLTSKEKDLIESMKENREQIIRSNPQNVQFSRLQKENQTNIELYNYLMRQLKSLDIQEKAKKQRISIVESAKLPQAPIRPRKKMNLIMGAITGLVLGISLALFVEYMDQSIKSVKDIEKLLNLPVLGVTPTFTKENM
jgi:uncharacterized protein involved in exopolysaccharide biosynthesis